MKFKVTIMSRKPFVILDRGARKELPSRFGDKQKDFKGKARGVCPE